MEVVKLRVGYVGNKNRYDYDQLVEQARSKGLIVYNLMNVPEEYICDDILRCGKIYVVGEKYEMNEFAQDVIAYANLMGKPILSLNGITESEIRRFTINFCMNMAESLMLLDEPDSLDEIFKIKVKNHLNSIYGVSATKLGEND